MGIESFCSEPVWVMPNEKILQVEEFYPKSSLPYTNFNGHGFIKISTDDNIKLNFKFQVEEKGEYIIDCRYANGTGTMEIQITIVQSGACMSMMIIKAFGLCPKEENMNGRIGGYSNVVKTYLNKGNNELSVIFEEWNTNMDGEINEALMDQIRVIKLK